MRAMVPSPGYYLVTPQDLDFVFIYGRSNMFTVALTSVRTMLSVIKRYNSQNRRNHEPNSKLSLIAYVIANLTMLTRSSPKAAVDQTFYTISHMGADSDPTKCDLA